MNTPLNCNGDEVILKTNANFFRPQIFEFLGMCTEQLK